MERIGKISGSKSQQVESDPEKERMRLELRSSFREGKIRGRVQKHIGEITGERALAESVSDLLDAAGNPPANAPLESIIRQQRNLTDQIEWLEAWSLVFDKKLRSLDKERYWRDRLDIERTEDDEKRKRRDVKGLSGIGEQDGGTGKLLESLDEAIQSSYRAATLRKYLHSDDLNAPVLGIRRIESGLRCVFAEYVDESYTAHMSVDEQYDLIREQLTWLGVMAAEIRSKLRTVIEISEAAISFLDTAGPQKGGE
jgi:hypothetical protein